MARKGTLLSTRFAVGAESLATAGRLQHHTSVSRSFSQARASIHSRYRRSEEAAILMSTCLKIAVATALLAAATMIAVTPPVSRSKDDDIERIASPPRPSQPSETVMFARD